MNAFVCAAAVVTIAAFVPEPGEEASHETRENPDEDRRGAATGASTAGWLLALSGAVAVWGACSTVMIL